MSGGERRQLGAKTAFQSYLNEARANNLWIYEKQAKRWYTPDEFEQHAIKLSLTRITGDDIRMFFALCDPIEGLKVRVDYAHKIANEVKSFADKIMATRTKR